MRIELDDVTLEVDDIGTGSPVMLLHGWPDTADLWRHQVPALVADHYRVIAPDLRGFGESSRPAETQAYEMSHMVGDVIGVLDHLSIPQVHLVGHDWGALVAWRLASRYPERLRTLTAVSVPHPLAVAEALASPSGDQLSRSAYIAARAAPGAATGAGSGHGDLEQRRPRPDRGGDEGLGGPCRRPVALRTSRRRRALDAAGGT
jgi:pimeloyl-ACP methyl ester carboxylesterase